MSRRLVAALVLLWLAVPVRGWAVVAHVQTVKTSDNDNGTTATSAAATFTTGGLAICTVLSVDSDLPTVTATLDGGSSFAVDRTQGSGGLRVTFLSFANVSSGSHTCNVTLSAATEYVTIFLTEVSGAATSAPQDGAGAGATGTSTAADSGSYSATASSFWIAVVASASGANPVTVTAGSGWTIPTNGSETDGATNVTGGVEYKANPGTTSHTGDFTVSNADWIAQGYAYLVASSAQVPCTLATTGAGRC